MSATATGRRRRARSLWLLISLSFRADPISSTLLCLSVPANYLAPAGGAVATKLLVDAATGGRWGTAALWAGVLAGLVVLATVGSLKVNTYLAYVLEKRVTAYVERHVAEMLLRLDGIEHYERPDHLDEVQQLRNEVGNLGRGLDSALNLFAQLCQVVVVCGLLAAQAPLLLALPLFAIPSFIAASLSNTTLRRAHERTARTSRMMHRLVSLVVQLPVAREARLYGLGDDLRERRRAQAAIFDRVQGRANARSAFLTAAGNLVFAIGYFGAIALVVSRAAQGAATAGDVALTIVLAGQTQGFISRLVNAARFLGSVQVVAHRLHWLRTYEREHRGHGQGTAPAPTTLISGIRLENVSFAYPGTDTTVLTDVRSSFPRAVS
jgi:ABC-type multidrug transport system fused ATPase/permease subunit